MTTITLNEVLELTEKLPVKQQDELFEEIRRRRVERYSKRIAEHGRKAEKDFRAGKLKAENGEAIVARWRREWLNDNKQ